MVEEQVVSSAGQAMTPEAVLGRTFTSAFRGYHPAEVKQFLTKVSDELAAGAAREVELRRALQEALHRAAHPEIDEATVTSALGEHAARLLATARETALSMTDDARKQADAVLRDAEGRVARMREEAESLLARRMAEADAATAVVRQDAEATARAMADEARAEAGSVVEAAKQQGKDMVGEAKDLRERMLADLSRRRRTAQLQLEQLRAARDRLLAAYDVVRRTVEEATAELTDAEREARAAADAVARRADQADDAPVVRQPSTVERTLPAAARVEADIDVDVPEARPLVLAGRAAAPRAAALLRRVPDVAPQPTTPDRPALRPQTVADAVGRHLPAAAPAPPPQPSDLSTMENPVVTVDEPPATGNGNGNGNGNGHAAEPPERTVDDLFARIRADRGPDEPPRRPALVDVEPTAPASASAAAILDPVDRERVFAERDALLDTVDAELTRALKRVLQDEQNEVLDRLRRLATAPMTAAAVLPDADAQVAAYRDASAPWLQQAARAGAGFASGSEPDAATPPVQALAGELAAELVGPLRDRLSRILDDADDPAAAAERLSAAYRQWKVQQVEESARHHVLAAFSAGALAAAPTATSLRWLVDDDGHCPDCDDNALAGPVPKGQPFPTGQRHPPAHPGCRCLLLPAQI